MHPSRWKAQAERWLALARRAQEEGNLRWAESLTARATKYFNSAAVREAADCKSDIAAQQVEER
jgi:hypothetical protein